MNADKAVLFPASALRVHTRASADTPLATPTTSNVPEATVTPPLHDAYERPLRDLRISVTDRCNFRCAYCMPKAVFHKDYAYLPQSALLSFEEISALAGVFVSLGVQKIRLTGGEPLLRKDIERLIEKLAKINTSEARPIELTLTTNGSLLAKKAQSLKDAGLQRVTVSLDALDDKVFKAMNDVDFPVADVLHGIDTAHAVGLAPVKVNMVVKRSVNDTQIVPMARHFRGTGATLRFIEYMDVGTSNRWRMDEVVPSSEVLGLLQSHLPLLPLMPTRPGETAQRWGYATTYGTHDASAGEIGLISSVTQAFCGDCNRARLSTEGQLYLCLFATRGYDLRTRLRAGAPPDVIAAEIRAIWSARTDRYSALRGSNTPLARGEKRVEMSYIGG